MQLTMDDGEDECHVTMSAPSSSSRQDPTELDASCQSLQALPTSLMSSGRRIRELTLAFNQLTSLEGLPQACPCLERLNASHNRLESLPSLSSLLVLRRLDVSHNRLANLGGVAGVKSLEELWAPHNALMLKALVPLGGLKSLRELVLHANPCEKVKPAGISMHAAVMLLPNLVTINGNPAQRAASLAFCQAQQARQGLLEELGTKDALLCLPRVHPSGAAVRQAQHVAAAPAPRRRRPPPPPSLSASAASEASFDPQDDSYLAWARATALSSSPKALRATNLQTSSPEARVSPTQSSSPKARRAPAPATTVASPGRPDIGPDASAAAFSGTDLSPSNSPSRSDASAAAFFGAGLSPPHPPPKARAAPQSNAAAQSMADEKQRQAQRRLQESERALAAALSNKPTAAVASSLAASQRGRPGAQRGRRKPPASSVAASMPSADSDMVVSYAAADGGGDALRIRTDGTASARYPGGALAVTVDPSGGRADRANAPLREGAGFVLTASFRRGGVAVSFDGSGGGSVNRRDGSLWLRHDPERGGSLHDACTGEVVRSWPAPAPASHGSSRSAMTGDAWVCERLDDHLAVSFCVEDGSFALPFTSGSVKHVLRLGHNAQLACWDEQTEPFLRSLSKAAAAGGANAGRRSRNTLPRGLEDVSISAAVASLPVFSSQRRRA